MARRDAFLRRLQQQQHRINLRQEQDSMSSQRNANGNLRLFIGLFLVFIAAEIAILMILPTSNLHKIIKGGLFIAKMVQGYI